MFTQQPLSRQALNHRLPHRKPIPYLIYTNPLLTSVIVTEQIFQCLDIRQFDLTTVLDFEKLFPILGRDHLFFYVWLNQNSVYWLPPEQLLFYPASIFMQPDKTLFANITTQHDNEGCTLADQYREFATVLDMKYRLKEGDDDIEQKNPLQSYFPITDYRFITPSIFCYLSLPEKPITENQLEQLIETVHPFVPFEELVLTSPLECYIKRRLQRNKGEVPF